MNRWRLKSCPRCGGDLLIERDLDFWYEQCLQCSHKTELKPVHEYKDTMAGLYSESSEKVPVKGSKD